MSKNAPVNKNSPVPAYHQITMDLIERIAEGEWAPNAKMPTEAVLSAEYGVSRITLRKALSNLESQKLVEIHQGKGIFVCPTPKPFVENLNFPGTAEKRHGSSNKSQLLSMARVDAPGQNVRNALGISRGTPVLYLKRIFTRDDTVIGVNHAWLTESMVPGLQERGLTSGSITQTLIRRYHYMIEEVESFVEATRMSVEDAAILKVAYDSTALKIQSIYYLRNSVPVQYANTLWLGDLTRFHLIVRRDDPLVR